MEKAMRSERIPDTDSIEELSRFGTPNAAAPDTAAVVGAKHKLAAAAALAATGHPAPRPADSLLV